MVKCYENPLKVESVTQFLDYIIKGIEKNRNKCNFYYRGENQFFPLRLPNFFTHENSEKLTREGSEFYYRSLINELGRVDYGDSFSLFQLMSELQHYEAKTRMLDISSNPLVALYFATEENKNWQNRGDNKLMNGQVYIFFEKTNQEKFDTGHTVAIKSALNFISQDKIDAFLIIMNELVSQIGDRDYSTLYKNGRSNFYLYESIDEILDDAEDCEDFLVEYDNREELFFFNTPLTSILQEEDYTAFCCEIEYKEPTTVLRNTLKQILEEFLELVNQRAKLSEKLRYPIKIYLDLINSHIILSSKRTDRLRQQQGAFIYPCFSQANKDIEFERIKKIIHNSIVSKATTLEINGEEYTHIIIPNEKKKDIQKELSLIGIDEGFIYPDIKHRSSALLNR
ncbi:FRG domain-containing protein [Streptococcus raffinosi]|uniref:FRG domain-containing protein n=1 Tax=Streptococcus raffinosi TaxID=3053355 RepID=A0ABT7LSF7_9STRE|nr:MULTISPECIES: FRG domain-containing protein [unclassified Streptococcus]MDL5043147.1 FRG domain-containing protein [Streptococcus sp. VTCC 12812]MDM0094067.1 FRG domain-containing protein [Streptococcus sp. VTCC 12813]